MIKVCIVLACLLVVFSGAANGERSYPQEVASEIQKGTEALHQGDMDQARQYFENALEMRSDCYECLNYIGLCYYRSGNLDKAAENYVKALELEPVFIPSITNLGAVRHQQKRLADATNLYRLALRLSEGKDAEIQFNLANVLRDQKKYDEARQHYLESIKLRPEFHAAHNGLGATYYCMSKLDDAEREIRYALKLKPDYSLAYYHLGLIQSVRKNHAEAIKAFEKSLDHEDRPDYAADTKKKIAAQKALLAQGDPTSATASSPPSLSSAGGESFDFQDIPASKRRDPIYLNNQGLSLLHKDGGGDLDEAISRFKTAIQLGGGKLYQAHYNLAQALKRQGNNDECLKECEKAIEVAHLQKKSCPLAHNLLAIVYKQKGDLARADQQYKLALALSMGKYPVIHYNRAILLEKRNKPQEAKVEYKAYLDKAPNGANANRAKIRMGLLSL